MCDYTYTHLQCKTPKNKMQTSCLGHTLPLYSRIYLQEEAVWWRSTQGVGVTSGFEPGFVPLRAVY